MVDIEEKAHILSYYLLDLPISEDARKTALRYLEGDEWEEAMVAPVWSLAEQGIYMPAEVSEVLDFEYFDDEEAKLIRQFATEDFDYEAHLDLLER